MPGISRKQVKYTDGLVVGSKLGAKHQYLAGLCGAKMVIHADSLYEAKQVAVEFWKPYKKDLGYLWVELVALNTNIGDGEPVVHVAVN